MTRRRGMSLIEVLAALVLVAIVLPAAMQAVTISMRAAQQARQQQEATLLAESLLGEILATRDPATRLGVGDFAPEFPAYRYEVQSVTAEFGLIEVSVTVTWQQRGMDRSVVLTTLVYPPPEVTEATQP